ncbi:MAG TPA: hypothetical protein VLA67_14795 [Nitrospiraceae bacterium]|nr:hypothetical protein [Nitrospiraceae bacterium]
MGSFFKIVSVTSCAFLMSLGLSFAMLVGNAVSGTDRMKAGPPGERIGGQGGRDYDQGTWKYVAARPGERIGGQGGRDYDHGTWTYVAARPGERIGGQGGRDYDQAKQRHVVAQAGQKGDQKKDGSSEGIKTVKGDVVRAEDNSLVIMTQDGNEMLLHIDNTTEKPRNIKQGEGIEAKVNNQNHVVAILSESAVHDRRNAK